MSIFNQENCWIAHPDQNASVLIDAEVYYKKLYDALLLAESQVFIVGWDFDTRLCLVRQTKAYDPQFSLINILKKLTKTKQDLKVYILSWKSSAIFWFEREQLQRLKVNLLNYGRIRLHYDGEHPISSSHHQKIVVIDDAVAFSGGIDLTRNRWDSLDHERLDPKRRNPDGEAYQPIHDVQIMVEGKTALSLGELCRDRWLRATGEKLSAPKRARPLSLQTGDGFHFSNAKVGIARTYPLFKSYKEVREIEQLYLDMIESAQRYIYIETQYFTSRVVAKALIESLKKPEGPEIVLVVTEKPEGLIEKNAVFGLQNAMLTVLSQEDMWQRLFICYPFLEGLAEDQQLKVHSKVMVTDDHWLRVGSSNLTNRSMGLDTECDILLEVDDGESSLVKQYVAASLAHFSEVSPQEFVESWGEFGLLKASSLLCIDQAKRKLCRYPLKSKEEITNNPLREPDIMDMDRPIEFERDLDETIHAGGRNIRFKGAHMGLLCLVLLAVCLSLLWNLPVVRDYLSHIRAMDFWRESSPWIRSIVFGSVYIVAGVVMFPVNVVTIFIAVLVPTTEALANAMLGLMLSATFGYSVGRWLLEKFFLKGDANRKYGLQIAVHSIVPVIVLRLLPIAPFGVINVLAGANRISFRRYALGSFVGFLPGTVSLVLLQKSLFEVIRRPDVSSIVLFAAVALICMSMIYFIQSRLTRYGS